jgi:hypothetical protein
MAFMDYVPGGGCSSLKGQLPSESQFMAYFFIPNFPRTTKWLTEEQRQLATWRLSEDIGEDDWVGSEHQTWGHGFKLAFTDINLVSSIHRPFHLKELALANVKPC